MKSHLFIAMMLALAFLAGLIAESFGGEGCCAHCKCQCECQKVCRLVKEEKKVEIVCWGCKHEDFCLPGPNQRCDKHCETVCDDATICTTPKNFVWYEWIPGCATMQSKTKLMKKTITKKIPSFKYVVEDLCEKCHGKVQDEVQKADLAPPAMR